MRMEIWSDIVCPFCYIGLTQFNKALDKFEHRDEVEIIHRSFQLQSDSPNSPEVKAYEQLAERKGVSVEDMKETMANVAEAGKAEGLEMNMLETMAINTFDGHRLIHFAAKHGKQEEALEALYEAYFKNIDNIADVEVLSAVASKIGLDSKGFKASLEGSDLETLVKEDIDRAARFGIQGVPAFIADEKIGTTGAQGEEGFRQFLEAAWKESHPIKMMGDSDHAQTCTDENCTV